MLTLMKSYKKFLSLLQIAFIRITGFLLVWSFLVTCSANKEISFKIQVLKENNRAAEGVRVYINQHHVGLTNKDGILEMPWKIKGSQEVLSVWVTDPNVNELTMGESRRIVLESSFWSKNHEEVFQLKSLKLKDVAESAITEEEMLKKEEESGPKASIWHSVPIEEQDTTAEIANVSPGQNLEKEKFKANEETSSQSNLDVTEVASQLDKMTSSPARSSEAPGTSVHENVFNVKIKVTKNGLPLEKAQIYAGRLQKGSFKLLGYTSGDGTLSRKMTKNFRSDFMVVRHACCIPMMRPLPMTTQENAVEIVLKEGVGHDVVALRPHYGILKTIEKAEITKAGARLDISNGSGYLLVSGKSLSENYNLAGDIVLPKNNNVNFKKEATSTSLKRSIFASKTHEKPSIGLVENISSEQLRKFRRDFLARFLQSQSFVPLHPTTFGNWLSEHKVSLENLIQEGWQQKALSESVDFVLTIQDQNQSVAFKLVDRSGNLVWSEKTQIDVTDVVEIQSKKMYDQFLVNLPLEASILTVHESGEMILNVGTKNAPSLTVGQNVSLFEVNEESEEKNLRYLKCGDSKIKNLEKNSTVIEVVGTLKKGCEPMIGRREKMAILQSKKASSLE